MPKPFETKQEKPSENLDTRNVSRDVPRAKLPVPEFSVEQCRTLLRVAHEAILAGDKPQNLQQEEALSEPRGVFTTLYLDGALRGCVGYALPVAPLSRAVAETARAAAFQDSRFPPVSAEEAARLDISLSVLSRLFPIHPEAVEVGRHGLVISDGGRRGLLLPQVPVEHGWDRETFLEQTCRKAGLPLDAWRKGAAVEAFTAEVFSDADVAR
jgi:AmmeMemoRadiSam system protein A